jgi:peptide/nickel transport system substrate-binding protein/oligopeptide transport system substrate-binding protein
MAVMRRVLAIAVCLVLAAGCSGGSAAPPTSATTSTSKAPTSATATSPGSTVTAGPSSSTTGPSTTTTAATAPPSSTAPPGPSGPLRVGISTPQTLDPTLAADAGALEVVSQLFTPLVEVDPATLAIQPGAAITWTVSPDQMSFTFALNPAAHFHSGRAVEAKDVKYALERTLRASGPAAPSLEVINGARDFIGRRDLTGVVGIAVVDARTVRFDLAEPFADFPAVLSNPALAPEPQEAVEGTAAPFSVAPVGNGPYKMARQWDQRSPIQLVAATETALSATGAPQVSFEPFGDLSRGLLALRRNELDAVAIPPPVLPAVDPTKEDLRATPFLGSYFFAFNLRDPNLAKPEFRKAIVAAIDRPALVKDVLKDSLAVRNGVVPAAVRPWPNDQCGDLCAHNARNAWALLVAAFPDGQIPPVNIDVDSDPTQVAVASAIRDQLRAVGIPAEVRSKPFQEYKDFITGSGTGEPGVFRSGWVSAAPTPDQFLVPLFSTGKPDNLSGYTSSDVDQTFADARKEPDPVKRADDYKVAEQKVLADVPVLPVASLQTYWVVAKGVAGLTVAPTGTFEVRNVSVSR